MSLSDILVGFGSTILRNALKETQEEIEMRKRMENSIEMENIGGVWQRKS